MREAEFLPPLMTGGSAGVAILEADGRIWLHSPVAGTPGNYTRFPSSAQLGGESIRGTALRAAFEATGLQVRLECVLGDFTESQTCTRYYLARRVCGSPARHGPATKSVSLVPFGKLRDVLLGEMNARIIRAIEEHTAPWECKSRLD